MGIKSKTGSRKKKKLNSFVVNKKLAIAFIYSD
jgi:hypothetical protein